MSAAFSGINSSTTSLVTAAADSSPALRTGIFVSDRRESLKKRGVKFERVSSSSSFLQM
jgi:hypothetical protein